MGTVRFGPVSDVHNMTQADPKWASRDGGSEPRQAVSAAAAHCQPRHQDINGSGPISISRFKFDSENVLFQRQCQRLGDDESSTPGTPQNVSSNDTADLDTCVASTYV